MPLVGTPHTRIWNWNIAGHIYIRAPKTRVLLDFLKCVAFNEIKFVV